VRVFPSSRRGGFCAALVLGALLSSPAALSRVAAQESSEQPANPEPDPQPPDSGDSTEAAAPRGDESAPAEDSPSRTEEGAAAEQEAAPAPSEESVSRPDHAVDTSWVAADSSEPRLEPGTAPDAQPLLVFDRIELAWAMSVADSLLVHFGEGKVSLAFSHGGPRGGLFTRTQAGYLLGDLFKYSDTEKFRFVKFRNIDKDGQLPYAVADRVFRLENGVLYHDQVFVSLRRESGLWKVAEIKSIDR
jgi:hypothetical protein